MNKNAILIGALVLILIGGAAYIASAKPDSSNQAVNQMPVTSGENPQPGSAVHDLPVEPAAAKARAHLAAELSVNEKSIVILQVKEETWSDGCLGLGGIAESCLQALVPGFEVEMLAEGKTYVYRTDKTGASVRMETK